ncbi:MAG: NHL repeat-containing protein [Bacteroidia bacterium]
MALACCAILVTVSTFPLSIRAQASIDTVFGKPSLVIPNIPKGVTDLEADQEGNLYLLQTSKHRIFKYFEMTGYDSVQTIGGKGIGNEGFNYPNKITVPNRQSVFVLDQDNRRLVQLNTNLRVVKDINFLTLEANLLSADVESFWPISFAVGPSGELYFLNQDDIKIYKFTTAGTLERAFGGVDYGTGSLKEPYDIALNPSNLVFAIDSSNQRVSIYDLYGTYQYSLSFPLDFRWKRMSIFDDNLFFLGESKIFAYNLFSKKGQVIRLDSGQKLIDAVGGKDFLYILWENEVHLHTLKSKE